MQLVEGRNSTSAFFELPIFWKQNVENYSTDLFMKFLDFCFFVCYAHLKNKKLLTHGFVSPMFSMFSYLFN